MTKVKEIANAFRDLKNWVAVYAEEYDLSEEAVAALNEKLDEFGKSLS